MPSSTIAIIPARGGSKGIKKKNLLLFSGKPLIFWTINHCLNSRLINETWVTTDDLEIANYSASLGASISMRPSHLAADDSTSESAWLHAFQYIKNQYQYRTVDTLVLPQATSPIRDPETLDNAISYFRASNYDSLFSSNITEDRFIWSKETIGDTMKALNYDFRNRQRRQSLPSTYLENGSFYITKPEILQLYGNRLGGAIGTFTCKLHEQFQIDTPDDVHIAEAVHRRYMI